MRLRAPTLSLLLRRAPNYTHFWTVLVATKAGDVLQIRVLALCRWAFLARYCHYCAGMHDVQTGFRFFFRFRIPIIRFEKMQR